MRTNAQSMGPLFVTFLSLALDSNLPTTEAVAVDRGTRGAAHAHLRPWLELLETEPPGCTFENNCRHYEGSTVSLLANDKKEKILFNGHINARGGNAAAGDSRSKVRVLVHYSMPDSWEFSLYNNDLQK